VELFKIPLVPIQDVHVAPVVETPLGTVVYTAEVNGFDLKNIKHSSFSAGDDSYLFAWMLTEAEVDLLLFRPSVPKHLEGRVTDSWAGIWRVKTLNKIRTCSFSCKWTEHHTWTHGGADSGEGLDAQTYEDGKAVVTIGTEDSQYIVNRAEKNDWMSYGLKPSDPHNFAHYAADGLTILLRDLESNDCCQFQFVVAWSNASDDIGPWLAVDRDYRDLLHRFNA
jgi:hypothetical protein